MADKYPLTPAQLFHHLPIRQLGMRCINVSAVCALQVPLDFGLLKKCIQLEYERNECMRVRFTKADAEGNVEQYIVDRHTDDIPYKDLSGMSMEDCSRLMQEWAFEEFADGDVPTCEITMVKLPEGFYGMFVHIDHRIADSCGMIVIINDLMQLYSHYRFGSDMPQDLSSFQAMLEKDLAKEANEKRVAKDKAYWDDQLDKLGEPLYSDIQGPKVLKASRALHGDKSLRAADLELADATVGVKDFELEADATKYLMDFCLNNQVSMTNLLLLGLRTYLSKCCGGQEDITVNNFISRRSTHAEWTSGGTRTVMFPCRTVISPDTEFLDAAFQIQDVQNHVYMHSNYSTIRLNEQIRERFNTPENTTYASMSLTYQPTPVSISNPHLAGIPVWNNWFTNGINTKKVYLTVSHRPDGGMHFSFHYQTAHLDDHDMELTYYYLMRILFKGIAEPDMPVGEIIAEL